MLASSSPSPPEAPIRLFVIVVAIAVLVSVVVGYLGLSGRLGTGIPGEKPPAPSVHTPGAMIAPPPRWAGELPAVAFGAPTGAR